MIKQEGDKWVLYTKDGDKVLGTHDSKEEAEAQERAIEENRSAESGLRDFHVRTAGSAPRREMYEGREHLVIPVIALKEAVIHAVNADEPEYVPADALNRAAHTWNGRPLVVGHPVNAAGQQISANDPAILAKQAFGHVFKSAMRNGKLGMEAWIDPLRLEALNQHALLADIRAGKPIEVSVGAHVRTLARPGTFGGRAYKAAWGDIFGDHLAFLPGGRGACSVEMGCGAHRAASEHLDDEPKPTLMARLKAWVDEIRGAEGRRNSTRDQQMIQTLHDHSVTLGAACGDSRMLKAKYEDCTACDGSGSKDGNPCEACEGNGQIKVRAASAADDKGEDTMTPEQKAAIIKALTACPCSGFKDTDVKMLEAASDDRLLAFKAAADANKATEDAKKKAEDDLKKAEDEKRSLAEKLTGAEDRLKTLEAAQIPAAELTELRALAEAKKTADAARKAELVTSLKAAQDAYTEDELKAMSNVDLEKLAKVTKVATPEPNYAGRGLAVHPNTKLNDFAPPDPYEAGLKALAESRKAN